MEPDPAVPRDQKSPAGTSQRAGTIVLASAFCGKEQPMMNRVLRVLGYALVTVYFVADLVFESVARPLSRWIGRLKLLRPLNDWIRGLRPYPALALFCVPVVILEPVKPIGAFLVSAGYVVEGALTIAAGEILKITLVERLFELTRDRLMQIPTFAMLYRQWIRFREWVKSSEIWCWARAQIAPLKLLLEHEHAMRRDERAGVRDKVTSSPTS
jgi:hypothetical protein